MADKITFDPTVKLLGPYSPFWECPECKFLGTTPLNFKHDHGCSKTEAVGDREIAATNTAGA